MYIEIHMHTRMYIYMHMYVYMYIQIARPRSRHPSTCEWVIISEWVMSQFWMSHITHVNKSCHTSQWVLSRIWMCVYALTCLCIHTHTCEMTDIYAHMYVCTCREMQSHFKTIIICWSCWYLRIYNFEEQMILLHSFQIFGYKLVVCLIPHCRVLHQLEIHREYVYYYMTNTHVQHSYMMDMCIRIHDDHMCSMLIFAEYICTTLIHAWHTCATHMHDEYISSTLKYA